VAVVTTRDEVLREIAADLLQPAELVAAFRGSRTPNPERWRWGCSIGSSYYRLPQTMLPDGRLGGGDVVEVHEWNGVTATATMAELMQLAADLGTPAAGDQLAAAIADEGKASQDATRYIKKHGEGGMVLAPHLVSGAEFQAIVARTHAAQAAARAWWRGEAPPAVPAEQLDLFGAVC
jgi:hypothetical protein